MKYLKLLALAALITSCTSKVEERVFDIVEDFGAVADGVTDCTDAINSAITACSEYDGKAIVNIPEGTFLSRTIFLKSNVELHLSENAVLLASEDADSYSSYIPEHDMSRYDSGDGTVNSNNSKDERWNRAFILGVEVENVTISGLGTIDGRHVFDSLGEEFMRGPHTVLFAESSKLCFKDFSITQAANYAIMGYALSDAEFSNLHISQGWDGIHIRGGVNVSIHDCRLETGDDAIAGGYWENMTISDNYINSSCNGIRMIMPSENLIISDCLFEGPGHYPHRTSDRTNMLFGVSLEPGAWGAANGDCKNIVLKNLVMDKVSSPIATSIREGSTGQDLTVDGLTATGCTGAAIPVVSWLDLGFKTLSFNNCSVSK